MSIITRSKKKEQPSTEVEVSTASVSLASRGSVAGLVPRAHLLPPELELGRKQRATRRTLRLVVVLVAIVTVAAVVGSFAFSVLARTSLEAAQRDTGALQAELANLQDIRNTQTWIANAEAAQKVGGSTEIDWAPFFDDLKGHLPADVMLTGVQVTSADAITPYEQSTIPLEKPRIGTVSFTATTSTLPQLPEWIASLSGVKGFADATPEGVTFADGVYTATVTMHIDEKAYSERFAKQDKGADK
jgi:Tfp pilus assembly protein PilN